jgi:hypothetical protein
MSLLDTYEYNEIIAGHANVVTQDVLIQSGADLTKGTVLGRVKVSVPTTGTADTGNTGNGTVTSVTGGPKTKEGTYTIKCVEAITNGGVFEVTGPAGYVGTVQIAPAGAGNSETFLSSEINFTITDGGTDFAVDDEFTIAVTEGVPNTGTAGGGNTGNGTVTSVYGRRYLKKGTYTLECTAAATNGGTFSVTDPDGNSLPDVVMTAGAGVSTDYESRQIAFTITDGGTDFAVGDTFTIAVSIHPRECVACDKTATDGSSVPYGVLLEDVDASTGAKPGVALVAGEVVEDNLTFASGTVLEDVRELFENTGIYLKPSIES